MITAKQLYSEIVKMPVSERAKLFTLIATHGFNESNYSYDDVFSDLPETVSLKDAAEYLGVAEITVRRWIKEGKLSPSRIGRNYAFNVSDLRTFKKRLV
ncbi:MAG: helix-turn-helix domain-containing protein [Geobacteraceae bacterium]|nr:helix-turn-helix domain-containing protein [Geobacteraceae bacterium]